MDKKTFEKMLKERIKKIENTLNNKAAEYAEDDDRLYNFKRAAEIQRVTPETALMGMFIKHFVSVIDIVEATECDGYPTDEVIDEKIGDAINYLILLEGLLKSNNKQ